MEDLLVGHENIAGRQLDLLVLTVALLDLNLLRLPLLQLVAILLSLCLFNNLKKDKLFIVMTSDSSPHIPAAAVVAAAGSAFLHDFVLNAGAGEE